MTNIDKTQGPVQVMRSPQDHMSKEDAAAIKAARGADKSETTGAFETLRTQRIEILFGALTESREEFNSQSSVFERGRGVPFDLSQIIYNGKPLTDLTPEEAQELVAEDGFFGVAQTSQRLADFVLNGAGDNLNMLQAGREGIVRGFQEAEKAFGGKLAEISYETLKKALEMIDARITELGGSVLDVTV